VRIVGGEAKGRVLKVVKSIRPTQEKVRGVLFNVLREEVVGVRFYDLFAGTGACGIEALSRGAEEAIFIEKSKKMAKIIEKNLKTLQYTVKGKIWVKDVFKVLNKIEFSKEDIIFADPPYNKGYIKKLLKLLPPCGKIIIEHSKHEPIEEGKNYFIGDTVLTFL
jgi:16S rRNA (guanine966-N2)-methyltransferase